MNNHLDKLNVSTSIQPYLLSDVIQQLSVAKDLETIIFIVHKAARKIANSDGATFVLKRIITVIMPMKILSLLCGKESVSPWRPVLAVGLWWRRVYAYST